MFCKNCGNQSPDGAGYCGRCGAPLYQPPQGGPPKKDRRGLWIGVAVAAVIVIAAVVTMTLLLLRDGDDQSTTGTTRVAKTTTTTVHTASSATSSSTSSTTSNSTSTSTTVVGGAPGDSPGKWVEMSLLPLPEGAYSVKVSDDTLLIETNSGSGYGLIAYPLGSDVYITVPISGKVPADADIGGQVVVWRDGAEDDNFYDYVDTSVRAYLLPSGPAIDIARGQNTVTSPQVDGRWISWAEHEPSDFNPEEYWYEHIFLQEIDASGTPTGTPAEFVSSAPAYKFGDSGWYYSMSEGYVAWEEAVPTRASDAGSYACAMDEGAMPQKLGGEAWRPSLGGSTVLYWDGRLMATDLAAQRTWELDSMGDYATAAPTYAVYARPSATSEELYEIVARGYQGAYEQVLVTTPQDPYFMTPFAVSGSHIAVLLDDGLHVYEWQAGR